MLAFVDVTWYYLLFLRTHQQRLIFISFISPAAQQQNARDASPSGEAAGEGACGGGNPGEGATGEGVKMMVLQGLNTENVDEVLRDYTFLELLFGCISDADKEEWKRYWEKQDREKKAEKEAEK